MPKRSIKDRVLRRVLRKILVHETRKGVHYMTSRARPKRADAIALSADSASRYSTQPALQSEAAAIVIQGPLWHEDDFTIETIRLYRRYMPDCAIILSTWNDVPEADLRPLEPLGVEIVLNEKPEVPGPFNVNMQIASASGGIQKAAELGVDWVLKTRTDQRLHHPTFMSGLISLAKLFPPTGAASETQRHRIFGLAQGTLKFATYHLSDQTVFGHIDDMRVYWSPPFRDAALPEGFPSEPFRIFSESTIGDLCRHAAPEAYFGSQFLMRQGRELHWTIADSWAAFRDHFGVVEQWSSDLYWVKGQAYTMRDGVGAYALTNARELSFLEWADLLSGALLPEAAGPYERVLGERTAIFDGGYP